MCRGKIIKYQIVVRLHCRMSIAHFSLTDNGSQVFEWVVEKEGYVHQENPVIMSLYWS